MTQSLVILTQGPVAYRDELIPVGICHDFMDTVDKDEAAVLELQLMSDTDRDV